MNVKHPAVIAAGILTTPVFAHAQAQAQAATEQSSRWGNLFWGIFPIALLIAIFILQHMERVEQSLDRIIKLLEKKD
jgi:hypothetical protein